jgi:hypothetical protein
MESKETRKLLAIGTHNDIVVVVVVVGVVVVVVVVVGVVIVVGGVGPVFLKKNGNVGDFSCRMGSAHCIQCMFSDGLKLVSSGSWLSMKMHGVVSLQHVPNV